MSVVHRHGKDTSIIDNSIRLDEIVQYLKGQLSEVLADGEVNNEYSLLKILQQDNYLKPLFITNAADSLALYRAHFLLFHALYQLADELAGSQQAVLEISTLAIRMCAYRPGQQNLTQVDAVREYYLDWQNYEKTGAQEVDELLASFWIGMHRLENRDEALASLGLTDPVDNETIRRTYQRLAMEHHPDRGGDDETIQAINAAVKLLLK